MKLVLLSEVINLIGTLMVIYAALRVHHRFLHEHQIDDNVFITMKKEQKVAFFGIAFIVMSFILDIYLLLLG